MNEKPTTAYWLIAIFALLWNLYGLFSFFGHLVLQNSEEALSALPPEQQPLFRDIPGWVMVCFGVAVFFGVLGCLGLLMRKKWAVPVFVFSLLGIIGQQIHNFFLSDAINVIGFGAVVVPFLIFVVAVALIFFSMNKSKQGLLN